MKIIFVNTPHIRSKNSTPENDFKIEGFVYPPFLSRIRGVNRIYHFCRKYFGLGGSVRYGVRAGSRWPFTLSSPMGYAPYPFFMGYAASYLQSHGIEVNIIDAIAEEEYSYTRVLDTIRSEKADIVVLECSTPTIDIDLWFAGKVAAFTEVALAGPHLNDQTATDIQKNNPGIKYLLLGEYILNSLKMAQTKQPGIYPSEVVKDIDAIPFPFRAYKSATKYYDPSMPTSRPQLQIYGSKGCPFKCSFCSWPQNMYFGIVSLRDPKKIAEEIRAAVAQHGYKSIFFDDDTFNLGTERISELCDYLKEIGLPWTMMGRLDCSPDWLYDKMVESGCIGMRFGVETFNINVLKRVKKGIERVDFRSTLEHISAKYPNLMIHLTMMKDMPEMTDEIHRKDLEILNQIGFVNNNIFRSYQLSNCVPFPGTALYREMSETMDGKTLDNFAAYDGGQDTVMKDKIS